MKKAEVTNKMQSYNDKKQAREGRQLLTQNISLHK